MRERGRDKNNLLGFLPRKTEGSKLHTTECDESTPRE